MRKSSLGILLAGLCAGTVNGLFGAGGGMVLIPLLGTQTDLDENEIFPASVCIILPISLISLFCTFPQSTLQFHTILPYLIGSAFGGVAAGFFGKQIPTKWLHRILGLLIFWGGIRYLC